MARLLTHITRYSLSNVLTTLAGIISFPILTRVLGADGYGIMSVINATLLVWVGLSKLGLQHAGLRFYSSLQGENKEFTSDQYFSSLFLGMVFFGLGGCLLWAASSGLVAELLKNDALRTVLLICSPLILLRVISSAGTNILRARQSSGVLSTFSVFRRYFVLAVVVLGLFMLAPTVTTFFAATVVAEIVTIAILMVIVLRGVSISTRHFSSSLLGQMMGFGLPMIGFELAGNLLVIGDRYFVKYYLGAEPLGAYSAAYNLCMYVQLILIAATAQAVMPAYLKLWEEQGREATESFLKNAMSMYVAIAIPAAVGLSAVGPDIMHFLAPESFMPGAVTIPYVIWGQVIAGLLVFFAAGLFIQKRSGTLTLGVIAAMLINLLLNYYLIPVMGILGAAIATLVSYILLTAGAFRLGNQHVSIHLPFKRIVSALVAAGLMFAAIAPIELEADWKNLLAKSGLGASCYVIVMLLIDSETRSQFRAVVRRSRSTGTNR